MQVTCYPGKLQGVMHAPASKSESHRRMICAGLSHGEVTLKNFMNSEDTEATARCLRALGAQVLHSESEVNIQGFVHKRELLPEFDCGESGSTLRFFVPLALTMCGGGRFSLHGRLGRRPMDVYRDLFVPSGGKWHMYEGTDGAAELVVAGGLASGDYVLPGDVSSQFVSGLLFALPLLPSSSTLRVNPPVESAGYIRMTIHALKESQIQIEELAPFYWRIPGGQHYQAVHSFIEGDWSQAAVLLCADALGSDVTVRDLSMDSLQGDMAVLNCLKQLGADIETEHDTVRVKPGLLRGTELDMHDYPDIAPMLALVCQFAEGESRLTGCGRLRLKECDRLSGTVSILNRLGGNAKEDGDAIVIQGVKSLQGGSVDSYHDHRMVMLASIAALVCQNPVEISDAEAIDKSWPDYLEVFRRLGGRTA